MLFLTLWLNADYGKSSIIIKGADKQPFSQDAMTNAITTIAYEHHEIHAGSHYYVQGFSTVASGDSIYFSVTTPNTTKWLHMVFDLTSSGAMSVYTYEGATVTGGTAVTPLNNNRNSSDTSLAILKANPDITSAGTVLDSAYVGAGQKGSGFDERNRELILKQNSTYLFIMKSGAATNYINYTGEWYEHTNKN